MKIHQAVTITLSQTAFSYTCCINPYRTLTSVAVQGPQAVVQKLGGPVVPCTVGVWFPKRTCQFTKPWQLLWHKRNFRARTVQDLDLCGHTTPTVSPTRPTGVVQKLGGPVAPRTVDVQLSKHTCQLPRPWQLDWRKRHFRTLAVRDIEFGGHARPTRSASYSRCTAFKTHMPVPKVVTITLAQTAFPYTCCTDPYRTLTLEDVQDQQAVVPKLGDPVAACTVGVQFLKRTCQFTKPW